LEAVGQHVIGEDSRESRLAPLQGDRDGDVDLAAAERRFQSPGNHLRDAEEFLGSERNITSPNVTSRMGESSWGWNMDTRQGGNLLQVEQVSNLLRHCVRNPCRSPATGGKVGWLEGAEGGRVGRMRAFGGSASSAILFVALTMGIAARFRRRTFIHGD